MKKLNWGTKLGIMASIYVIGVLIFVGFSTTQKINLVSKDYYPTGVKHQDQINKIKNAVQLETPVRIEQVGDNIEITFPANMKSGVEGDIIVYRPADYDLDLKYKLALNDSGVYILNTNKLLKGRYTIKLDWVHNNIPYYKEEAIYLSK
ncbi:FixH family protein [Marinifilum fragile]|uniref:FixH family protein n=1 Tax=Marinifilum fragile TaxID=570161 RepID=UPI0006D0A28D|nr:FixH family protein [Marinifilum fragile]